MDQEERTTSKCSFASECVEQRSLLPAACACSSRSRRGFPLLRWLIYYSQMINLVQSQMIDICIYVYSTSHLSIYQTIRTNFTINTYSVCFLLIEFLLSSFDILKSNLQCISLFFPKIKLTTYSSFLSFSLRSLLTSSLLYLLLGQLQQ